MPEIISLPTRVATLEHQRAELEAENHRLRTLALQLMEEVRRYEERFGKLGAVGSGG